MVNRQILTIKEAAERSKQEGYCLSEYTLRRAIRSGAIPCRIVGKTYLIAWPNIVKWLMCEDGLFFNMDNSVIDSKGTMGYSYPGDIAYYPQEAPIGATCKGQVCIGVDNPGLPIKLNVVQYDGTGQKQAATFSVE